MQKHQRSLHCTTDENTRILFVLKYWIKRFFSIRMSNEYLNTIGFIIYFQKEYWIFTILIPTVFEYDNHCTIVNDFFLNRQSSSEHVKDYDQRRKIIKWKFKFERFFIRKSKSLNFRIKIHSNFNFHLSISHPWSWIQENSTAKSTALWISNIQNFLFFSYVFFLLFCEYLRSTSRIDYDKYFPLLALVFFFSYLNS